MNSRFSLFLIALFISSAIVDAQTEYSPSEITKIPFLGTGTPNADPNHSGNSIAIIVNNVPYIIDCGAGLIRNAAKLTPRFGGEIEGLAVANIKRAFITHLHSDHTTGYPDLIFTPWVFGRDEPLEVYGPEGIVEMTGHITEAYREDISMRLYGLEPANNQGWRANAHEYHEGVIYTDSNVVVEAFKVEHGSWHEAYGFIFTTPDMKIAISGDTRPCANLVEKCTGVDVLIHEVYSAETFKERKEVWKTYHSQFHTSTTELAEIANQVKPGLLIMYHQLYWGATDDDLVKEVEETYKGKVLSAKDLDVY
ncbi:MAG: MBL fold metallo-hydrolase [Candidatus Electryonea clarkiae]|nr:MBL fold metallo-hydrolase [Candidatus Electryonea clarkiae]MDP8287872.1 MBL fold metallo-hydrolase [Candidatus Electryonea clarkiae]